MLRPELEYEIIDSIGDSILNDNLKIENDMLQDPNVVRVIKNYTEPLQKQISMMQIELEALKQQCNVGAVSQQRELLLAFYQHLIDNDMETKVTKTEKASNGSCTLLGTGGICKITNDKFSWVLEVDGKKQ